MHRLRQAKWAVAMVFALNGLSFASWVSRVPAVRETLDLTSGQLGLLLLALSAGTLLALPLSGAVVHRLGPARAVAAGLLVVTVGAVLMAAGLVAAQVPMVAAGMAMYGVGTSTWDVSMNVEAADVERRIGRTLMPRFHAGFSLGTVAGALIGAGGAGLGVSVAAQIAATAAVVLVTGAAALRWFLPVTEPEKDAAASPSVWTAWREPRTLVVGVLVLAFALSEGIANDWLALALVDGYDASETVGALAFGVFVAAMTLGRTVGGSMVERLGRVLTLQITAALVITGVTIVIASPTIVGAMAGALLWGLGASLGFPLGMSAAADDEARSAARVSVVASIGYTAFFAGPPLVGLLADSFGVRQAVAVALAAALLGLVTAGATRPQRSASAGQDPQAPSASLSGSIAK